MLLIFDNTVIIRSNPFFSSRIPKDLNERIKQHINETEESKTDILINALATYLNCRVAHRNNPTTQISKEMFVAVRGATKAL